MKATVTNKGVVIPKNLLEGIKEVEIQREKDRIIIIPISKDNLILQLGKDIIKKIAGIVEHGHLAEDIEEELYGKV